MKDLTKSPDFPGFSIRRAVLPLIAAIVIVFGASSAKAVVTVDNSSSGGAFASLGVSSLNVSHTVGSGISRALVVGVSTSNTTLGAFIGNRVSGVTYNSQALTRLGSQVSANQESAVEIFILVNPPSGTSNIIVNLVAASSNYAFAGAVSFNGVDQTTPTGSFVSAAQSGTAPNATISDSSSGDIVFDTVASPFAAAFLQEGANQAVCTDSMDESTCRRGRRFFSTTADIGASSIKNGSAAPVLMSWTLSNSANWAIGAFAIRAYAASAASGKISGKVVSGEGRGIPRAVVSLTNSTGETQTARTNGFGYFRFNNVLFGETYVVEVQSKEFNFQSEVLTFEGELNDLILTVNAR